MRANAKATLKRAYDRSPRQVKAFYRAAWKKLSVFVKLWQGDEWTGDPRVNIGQYTYGIRKSSFPVLTAATRISIGKYCSIAPGVVFVVGRHRIENVSNFPFKAKLLQDGRADDEGIPMESIVVGHDVWIGTRAVIVANVTLGHGSVVAAGSVVVKDVPPYAVVGGVPAKLIKMRFGPEHIQKLLEIAWWDWPEERIRANIEMFYGDPDTFIRTNSGAADHGAK